MKHFDPRHNLGYLIASLVCFAIAVGMLWYAYCQ